MSTVFRIALSVLGLIFINQSFVCGQINIETEIANSPETPSYKISKARYFLLTQLQTENYDKVAETQKYLNNLETTTDYLSLFPLEQIFIYYWTQDYESLLAFINSVEESSDVVGNKLPPDSDLLYPTLSQKSFSQVDELKAWLHASTISEEDKTFLELELDFLLSNTFPGEMQDIDLQNRARSFTSISKDTFQVNFVESYMLNPLIAASKVNPWKFGVNFLTGMDIYTGKPAQQYSPTVLFGVQFELTYKQWSLILIDELGFGKTRRDWVIDEITLADKSPTRPIRAGILVGHSILEKGPLAFRLDGGLIGMSISPTEADLQENKALQKFDSDFKASPQIGLSFDYRPYADFEGFHQFKDPGVYLRCRYGLSLINLQSVGFDERSIVHSITFHLGWSGETNKARPRYYY